VWFSTLQRGLTIALAASTVLLLLSGARSGNFPDPDEIRPALRQEPVQAATEREPFSFDYMGESYRVRPVADYEFWGLVVTHNDVDGFGDIYHDETSVDTKDLCVIWGPNLVTADYQQVTFDSVSFVCYWQYGRGVSFQAGAIANNHLITDSPYTRDVIDGVRVGDQIHVTGSLVDYQPASYPNGWRETSTSRIDEGMGACEVVFVDRIEVLQAGTPMWYALNALSWWLVGLLVAAKAALLVWETRRRYV
jgi:hypothetical protein